MEFRTEHDSLGEVRVPADRYWGAQTQRSRENFQVGVGIETMPREIIEAFALVKIAASRVNRRLNPNRMTERKQIAIEQAAWEILDGTLKDHFPLVVWQTGSGTQSNMNVNEVIANRANEILSEKTGKPDAILFEKPVQTDAIVSENLCQSDLTVSEKPIQNDATVTEKPVQAVATVSEKPGQFDAIVSENLCQSNAAVSEKPGKSEEILSEKTSQPVATVSEKPGQTDAIVSENLCQSNATVSKKHCQSDLTVSEKPIQNDATVTEKPGKSEEILSEKPVQPDAIFSEKPCHPNDDVNMSQSSNDVFPTAMHIAAAIAVEDRLIPAAEELIETFKDQEARFADIVKCGRTHLQDAVPLTFSQEISGWRSSVERGCEMLRLTLPPLRRLALGATAVGTGLNAPSGFAEAAAAEISRLTGKPFRTAENKFHALTSQSELVCVHGAVKALAMDLLKIANDIRWLASGPRCGLGEITIPANEPGSSIMPGKVNPTQCEQLCMVAVQVCGNDAALAFAASQGNFELNVYMPVMAYNFLQSVRLLSESVCSFTRNCVAGIKVNREKMRENLSRSLMTVTALNPYIGYENAAKVAQLASLENITLREACLRLGVLTGERFDEIYHPEKMT